MKYLRTTLMFLALILGLSSFTWANEGSLSGLQEHSATSSFAVSLLNDEWRRAPDIFYLAAVKQAQELGLPEPKLPAECIEGLQCSNSRICVGGGCVDGHCEC